MSEGERAQKLMDVAKEVAHRVFERRGNNSEVHLNKAILTAVIIVGIHEWEQVLKEVVR